MSIGWAAVADTAVRTEDLRRYFDQTRAVDGVDLEVKTGEIYGFLGPNGAGKSTLLHVLCTLLLPTSGRAEVAGFDVARQPIDVRLRIGVALHEASLDPAQTGIELLRLQGRLYGLTKAETEQRLRELTQLVDIGPALGHRIKTYSGGMRRRLDLAAALVHNPQVVFLDEPTTGLDPASRVRVWDEVRRLNEELGMTIFLTTQYLEEADVLADRVGIIDRGHIVAEGTPDELKRDIGGDSVEAIPADPHDLERAAAVLSRFGEPAAHSPKGAGVRLSQGAEQLADIVRALDEEGVTLAHLQLHSPSLDDVFLAKTGRSLEGAGGEDEPAEEPVPA
jgi:ABC-2 type transport system ATP-binding protein